VLAEHLLKQQVGDDPEILAQARKQIEAAVTIETTAEVVRT
jgi:hypothetical protein